MNKNVNTKPFYNSTIPDHWTTPEFGEVFSFLKTFSFSREQLSDEKTLDEIQNIHYGDIHSTFDNEILDFEIEKRVPYIKDGLLNKEEIEDEDFPVLKDGDLVIADASEDYDGIAECVELKNISNRKVVGGLHTFVARGKKEAISSGYRTYVLKHPQVVRELHRIATGFSVFGISKTNLEKIKLPLPPDSEQYLIADLLHLMDTAINKNNMLITKKESQKKWLMQMLLTGKKRLKGFEKTKWVFTDILKLFNPIDRYVEWNDEELYNLISIRRRNGGVFFREPLYGHQIGVKKLKVVLKNDFVISKRQVSHGAWAVIDDIYNQSKVSDEYDCLEISNQTLLTAAFWKWFCQLPLLTHYANVDSDGVHIEKSIFDFNLFKKRKVLIPTSVEEQVAIAQMLQASEKEIQLLKTKSGKLKEEKKGLMQQLLTGKKRLITTTKA